ncbi:MAG: hypothetical protein U0263_27395 [Polyangiaceae bacterium]
MRRALALHPAVVPPSPVCLQVALGARGNSACASSLTFLWPDVRPMLERHGFEVTLHRNVCPPPFTPVLVVSAGLRGIR